MNIARAHEAAREDDLAARRYTEALSLDLDVRGGILGLGSLRARRGDLREAERVYNVALEHLPQLRRRASGERYVRRALGARAEAIAGSARRTEEIRRPAHTRGWYGEEGQTPAQLAVWRRIIARAEATQDTALLHEARTTARALVILVGPRIPPPRPRRTADVSPFVATLARKGELSGASRSSSVDEGRVQRLLRFGELRSSMVALDPERAGAQRARPSPRRLEHSKTPSSAPLAPVSP